MTWLIWRLQRAQVMTSLVIVLSIILLWVVVLIEASGCPTPTDCGAPMTEFIDENYVYYAIGVFLLSIVLGLFAGGPLFAREFEERTYAFVITQRGHHGRWLLLKLVIAGVPVAIAITALGVLSAYVHERAALPLKLIQQVGYIAHGPLLGAWFLLAFTFAALAGVIGRRTLMAMVVAAVAVVPVSVAASRLISPAVLPPQRVMLEITSADRESADYLPVPEPPGESTIIGHGYLTAAGVEADGIETCNEPSCRADVTESYTEFYFNGDFWTLQALDMAAYALVAAGALIITVRRLAHRRL